MDVLVSGSDRPPADRLGRLLRRPLPRVVVVGVGVAGALVLASAAVAVGPVRTAQDLVQLEASEVRSVVTVRTRSRDGVLLLDVVNRGRTTAVVRGAELELDGARGGADQLVGRVAPGGRTELAVPYALPRCPEAPLRGRLRLDLVGQEPVDLVVAPGSVLPSALLAAGCGEVAAGGVAVGVRGAGGSRTPAADGLTGTLLVEVRNEGAQVDRVRVGGEAPGAVLSTGEVGPLGTGERAVVRLAFSVPDCALLRRTGRVVVTVLDGAAGHELGFRLTEDEEARTVRDVNGEVLLGGCRDGQPVP